MACYVLKQNAAVPKKLIMFSFQVNDKYVSFNISVKSKSKLFVVRKVRSLNDVN